MSKCELRLLKADWDSERPNLLVLICSQEPKPKQAEVELIAQLDDCDRSSVHKTTEVKIRDCAFSLCLPRGTLTVSVKLSADGLKCAALFTRESRLIARNLDEELFARVQALPLFQGVACRIIQRIVQGSFVRTFPPGTSLIQANQPGNIPERGSVFIIFSGQVEIGAAVVARAITGELLATLGPGALFGEQATLIGSDVSVADACTVGETTLLVIPKVLFFAVLPDSRNLALNLLRVVEQRLFDTNQIIANF